MQIFDVRAGAPIVEARMDSANMSLRYTPDGKYLVEGDMNAKGTGLGIRIWDGRHRELLQEIPGNVSSIAVTRDGRYLATGMDGRTILWQLK